MTEIPIKPHALKPQKRKLIAAMIVGTLVILVTPVVIYSVSLRARSYVISKPDSLTGLHIEYSISGRHKINRPIFVAIGSSLGLTEVQVNSLYPPPKFIRWFQSKLSVSGRTSNSVINDPGKITVTSRPTYPNAWMTLDENGYPHVRITGTIVTSRKLLVDGCPSIWNVGVVLLTVGSATSPTSVKNYQLTIQPKGVNRTFTIEGSAVGDREGEALENEINSIRESIRVLGQSGRIRN